MLNFDITEEIAKCINNARLPREDKIVTAIAADGMIRMIGAETTNLCEEARRLHNTSAVATAALGRLLTAAALLSNQLKNETDSITVQIRGEGPLGGVVAVSDAHANVRGYVTHPEVELPVRESDGKLDVGGAIGKGYLNIIKDLGLKEPYVGTSELISGEIAEDLTYYLAVSEQVPSVVALGVRVAPDPDGKEPFVVERAGGFLLQLMPGASDALIDDIERQLRALPSVTTLLAAGATIENIMEDVLIGLGFEVQKTEPCGYKCYCSEARMEKTLISIGANDLQEIIDDGKGAEICCHFCNKRYFFDTEDIKRMLAEASSK